MLAKTGLLVISNPASIEKILSGIKQKVKSTLYIQLLSALTEPLQFHPNLFTSHPKYSHTIWGIYSQVAQYCQGLDVRVLLSSLKYKNVTQIKTSKQIDLVVFDKSYSQADIDKFLQTNVSNIQTKCKVITVDRQYKIQLDTSCNDLVYKHTVLGGTFDRLHVAHKILLTEVALRSTAKVTVGVTEENMLKDKCLWELIEPIDLRVSFVKEFLTEICPELDISVEPISDAFGPTQHDPTMELLVLSKETVSGGQKVNEVRASKGLPILSILPVDLVDDPHRMPNEEKKISSSTTRLRLLGSLLKPARDVLPKRPYVIGLTGGITSGKSTVSKILSEFGAEVIDCDKVAHDLYHPGMPCHTSISHHFGPEILADNGEINRKTLGGIVFQNPDQLSKLNSIVWPAISLEVQTRIKASRSNVIVVEAAVLLSAGWSQLCHEVWTMIVPQTEAILRLKLRNNLSEEEATRRIAAQPDNKMYVAKANVVFCSMWSYNTTRDQVEKAWMRLQGSRL